MYSKNCCAHMLDIPLRLASSTPHAGRQVLLCLRPQPATHMLQHPANNCAIPTTPLNTCCQPTKDNAATEKAATRAASPLHLAPDETARPLLGHCARLAVTQCHQVTDHTCLSGRVGVDGHCVSFQERHAHVQDQHLRDELHSQADRELRVAHHTP